MFWGGQTALCTFSELGKGLAVALLGDRPHRVFTSQAGVVSVLHAWLGGNENVSALWLRSPFSPRSLQHARLCHLVFPSEVGGVSPRSFLGLVSCCQLPTWELGA